MRLGRLVSVLLAAVAAPLTAGAQPCDLDVLNTVYFDVATAALTPDAVERLEENVAVLGPCPEVGVLVEAATDEEEAMAEALSALRAEAVATWYLAHGVDAERVAARGLGQDPNSSAIEDPGPGDARARRADSMPVPVSDLPADAQGWAVAPRTDPAPVEQTLAEGVTLTLDWDLATAAECPARPDDASALALAAAAVTVDGRRTDLDVACIRSAWPGSALVGAVTSRVADRVVLVRGTVSPNGMPEAVVWMAGPAGGRRLESDPCLASEAYAAALALDLRALAEADRAGDTEVAGRAADAALANGGAVLGLAAAVAEVGGPAGTRRLDCAPVEPHFDH